MKTQKVLGFFAALLLMLSVQACGPTYYSNNRYGNRYAHRHYRPYGYGRPTPPPPPARPYGDYRRW